MGLTQSIIGGWKLLCLFLCSIELGNLEGQAIMEDEEEEIMIRLWFTLVLMNVKERDQRNYLFQ